MRRYVAIALVAGLIALSCGRNTQNKPASSSVEDENPIILVSTISLDAEALQYIVSDTLQLGRMHSGEILSQRVRIVNNSDEKLVITDHKTSCGCTTVEYERKPIEVGKYSDIVVSYDSSGEWGWQMQLLELQLAQKEYPIKIYIDAEVY